MGSESIASSVGTDAYRLPLPDGWADHTVITIAGAASADGFAPNVVVTRQPLCQGLGLGGFADGQQSLMRDEVDRYELLANEHREVAGARALVRTVRFELGEGPALRQRQAFLLHDGVGYTISCTASDAGFDDVDETFVAILNGFQLA